MTISVLLSDPSVSELVNHLWQSTVVVGIAWALAAVLKKNHAQVRYWVWFAASVKFLVPFSVLFAAGESLRSWIPTPPVHPGLARAFEPLAQLPVGRTSDAGLVEIHHPNWVPGLLLALWACGVLVVIARSVPAWLRVHAAKRSGKPMELPADVPVIVSRSKIEPGIIGIFRPVLLIPEGLLGQVSTEQLRAIISHEMCHVRRRDNLTFALHMFIEAVFWFYPVVWWIGTRLIDERERACDEAVVQLGGEVEAYAEAILTVCKLYVESPLPCVAGVTGADLKKRIVNIMTGYEGTRLSPGRKLILAATLGAAVTGPLALGLANAPFIHAQLLHATGGPAPSFEVATIKPADPAETHLAYNLSPGFFKAKHASLMDLLKFAYEVKSDDQVVGGPDWMTKRFFDVEAKVGANQAEQFRNLPPERKMEPTRLMVQSMLAERFQMKRSFKLKDLPVYALVIAKGGPKLKPEAVHGAAHPASGSPVPQPSAEIHVPTLEWTNAHQVTGKGAPINMLIGWLVFRPELGGRPVIDETGLTGGYDFVLEGIQQNPEQSSPDASQTDQGASIFTILQEQLGLKLVPRKAPVEVLVIDHAEQPSQN